MTKKITPGIVVIEATADAKCSLCEKIEELRPYGKNGAWVCFECMMKDEEEGKQQFSKLFDGSRDI